MKRRLVLSVAVLLVGAYCYAGNGAGVDEISIDTRAAFHQQFDDDAYGSRFQGEYLNLTCLVLCRTISLSVSGIGSTRE